MDYPYPSIWPFGSTFPKRTGSGKLFFCRQFYGTYPQIRKSLISKFDLIENGKTLISQLPINPTDELTCEDRTISVRLEWTGRDRQTSLDERNQRQIGKHEEKKYCPKNLHLYVLYIWQITG